jgi:hypothetical protein
MTFETEWARCSAWLQAALDATPAGHTLDDVKALVERREARLWSGRASAMVTELQVWPQEKWLLFWLAGGDLDELVNELRPMAEDYARENGCSRSIIIGRPGWERALTGYRRVAVSLAKEL